jgi:hypothetical protein
MVSACSCDRLFYHRVVSICVRCFLMDKCVSSPSLHTILCLNCLKGYAQRDGSH